MGFFYISLAINAWLFQSLGSVARWTGKDGRVQQEEMLCVHPVCVCTQSVCTQGVCAQGVCTQGVYSSRQPKKNQWGVKPYI